MVFGPSGRLFYAPKICQIPETDNNPDKTSGTFNGLKVRFFGTICPFLQVKWNGVLHYLCN